MIRFSQKLNRFFSRRSLMIIAWLTCASIGVIIARHFKPLWHDSTIADNKVWFQVWCFSWCHNEGEVNNAWIVMHEWSYMSPCRHYHVEAYDFAISFLKTYFAQTKWTRCQKIISRPFLIKVVNNALQPAPAQTWSQFYPCHIFPVFFSAAPCKC